MSEECHIYIVRRADQEEWMAKAKEGEGIAAVCMRAGGEFVKDIPNESLRCTCCDVLFSPSNLPDAFIVMIPVEHDPSNFDVQTQGCVLSAARTMTGGYSIMVRNVRAHRSTSWTQVWTQV